MYEKVSISLYKLFLGLVDQNNPQPIRELNQDQLDLLSLWLEDNGLVLDPQELGTEALASLNEQQFRTADTGRGPGMKAIMGEEMLGRLMDLCRKSSEGQATRIVSAKSSEPLDGTEGRGCQQAAADLLAYVITEEIRHLNNLNRRIWKGSLKSLKGDEAALARINQSFEGCIPTTRKTASTSGDAFWAVWLFLTGQMS